MLVAIVTFHYSEISRTVDIWVSSGTYHHCFAILPLIAYLIWEDRTRIADLSPRPAFGSGFFFLLFFSSSWLLSHISGIAEGVQFSIVGLVQAALLTTLGWRIYARLFLPFFLLWMLVPTGTVLIPSLQAITATGTEALLTTLTGIPTFRDGLVIEIPTGVYVVAEGCAGLNFLLASIAISLAYADLVYRSWRRRFIFIASLVLLSLLGNIVRVFLIIFFAHLTNNVGNIVDDHLIYGWGFFSILMLGAMWIGQGARQDAPATTAKVDGAAPGPLPTPNHGVGPGRRGIAPLVTTALGVLVIGGVPATFSPDTMADAMADSPSRVSPPRLICDGDLRPEETGIPTLAPDQTDAMTAVGCSDERRRLFMVVALLDRPLRAGKLVGLENRLIDRSTWHRLAHDVTTMKVGDRSAPVLQETIDTGERRLILWSLRWAGGDWRAPVWDTALADLRGELTGRRRASLILVGAESFSEADDIMAKAKLRAFLSRQSPPPLVGD